MALQEISLDSTGRYACQVTLDAPPFLFVAKSGHMTVISLPERIPVISGLPKLKPNFNIGDRVNINCSCHNTFPPANLHWFINNKQVLLSQSAKGFVVKSQFSSEFRFPASSLQEKILFWCTKYSPFFSRMLFAMMLV